MIKKLALPGLFAIPMLLGACSGILSSEQAAQQIYLLEPVALSAKNPAAEELPVLVFALSAVPGLDTNRIQALDADARLNQYGNARWPDFLPETLTSVVRRSLVSSDRFAAITTATSATSDGWELTLEVQQFYGVQRVRGTTDRVSAVFGGRLQCGTQDHRLDLSASIPVSEERLSVVVAAYQQALDDVTHQLWVQIESRCEI